MNQIEQSQYFEYMAKDKEGKDVIVVSDIQAFESEMEELGFDLSQYVLHNTFESQSCASCDTHFNHDDLMYAGAERYCQECLDKKFKITFRMADTHEPFELLRLSKDAFYDKISEELSSLNDHIGVEVQDAELEFVVETVDCTDYVYIEVKVLDYSIEE